MNIYIAREVSVLLTRIRPLIDVALPVENFVQMNLIKVPHYIQNNLYDTNTASLKHID